MRKLILTICFFILLGINGNCLILVEDTTTVEVRNFDETRLEQYRKKASFNYESKESWISKTWNSFWRWVRAKFKRDSEKLEKTSVGSGYNTLFTIGFIALAITLIIIGLTKVKFGSWITGRGAKVKLDYEVLEENIHELDFENEIKQAELEQNYRRAIRIHFLWVLKSLSDQEQIFWDPNKTNQEYKYEIRNQQLQVRFVKVVDIFDLVWYGEIFIDKSYYENQKIHFLELIKLSGVRKLAK